MCKPLFFFFSASGPTSQGVYYRVTCILWLHILLNFTLESYFIPKYEECKDIKKRDIQFFGFNAYCEHKYHKTFYTKIKVVKNFFLVYIAGSLVNSLLIVAPKTAPILLSTTHFFA